ncbi:MAG: nucleotidyltransferase domain-containing protein [Candidatus Aminicenantes bacterium]|nr:nucleotidyltransferase domain-containing protein [Candidatus Aminicenantes bacterium]NIN18046.1 nucleotidyltransferase domain-containing protein [Candidatus Aminicenantes bacterium]NIN41946.1 nucleotidyltransferase domain-containing protein [Candidatus Aminicenantes bacterium]NIN84701.1 nucleotidyltransferase domain-containing protein [Candidatus Aminicenantes bacterium]NIO80866.1 nucleotidyltransferase domain-containing protein [Candidatus Aminicenantes bacterium]
MKNAILEKIKTCLMEREEILFAYILGTFLNTDDFKDIDVAVYLDEEKIKTIDVFDYEMDLSLELEDRVKPGETFERYVPIDIKVVNLDCAQVSFRYSVSKGSLLFSRDEIAREEFLCRTWQEYFDFQYMSNTYLKEVLNG